MRIVVTGAFGFVGLNVAHHLAQQGHHVIAVGRAAPDKWVTERLHPFGDRVVYRAANLQQRGELIGALEHDEFDVIVHPAVITATTEAVERDESAAIVEVNIGGTMEALDAARRHRCQRFVYVSSPSAIGSPDAEGAITEEVVPEPLTLYGITKLSCEMIVRRYGLVHGLSTLSVRIAQPYGPGERPTSSRLRTSPIYEWLVAARAGERLVTGPFDVARDWTYIDDTVGGIGMLATADTVLHDLYHLGLGQMVRVGDVIATLRQRFPDLTVDDRENPPGLNPNIAGPGRRAPLDVGRFHSTFGWVPQTGIEEGMRRYFDES